MTTIDQGIITDADAGIAGSPARDERAVEAFAERMVAGALATTDMLAAYVGDRLGWYRSLAAHGPSTPDELAERTATSARYAREWLEQQAVAGILDLEAADGDAAHRRYRLPAAAAEVLTDPASLAYLAPLARMLGAVGPQLPALLAAYRTGGGVSWAEFGEDAREAQGDLNRPWFDRLPLAMAAVPSLDATLRAEGARVADVGTGEGWSAISLALAHPRLRVEGFDVDEPSVIAAREHARAAGVDDRVRFHVADAAGLHEHGAFDAAFAFECVHDMPHPTPVLEAMRRAVTPGGHVIVMDEAVADELVAPGDDLERLMYGYSLFVCLPDGLSHPNSAGTGTVMRPSILRGYALDAGFSALEVLPIEEFGFFRFYRLVH